MKLSEIVENPDNPQDVTDAAFEKIVRLVKENPTGLTADRIAYVTDHAAGKRVVLQGNKRLRALKRLYGDAAEVPDAWFQDITAMSEDQRDEFIIDANINDGKFVTSKLLAKYDREKLGEWVSADKLAELIDVVEASSAPASGPAGGAAAATVKLVEFKVALSSADFKRATEVLRKRSDDMAVAFMEVVNERA